MNLLEKDIEKIERISDRFALWKDKLCLVIGVCNPSEEAIKKALEVQLKNKLEQIGFHITQISLLEDEPRRGKIFSSEREAQDILYWLDLMAGDAGDVISNLEQYREGLINKSAAIFILSDFDGFNRLKEKAPNFSSLAFPVFFGIESFIEEISKELNGKFTKIIDDSKKFEKEIDRYIQRKRSYETNYFLNLRQWNSYTPILSFREGDPRGGGYFLKWDDTGIVIDPGHGFIQNLFECGLGIADIDAIIITHDHPDHTQEFPLLIDLLYQFNKRKSEGAVKKQFSFLLNTSSFSKFAPIIRYETKPELCQVLWRHKEIRLGKTNSIIIKPTITKHEELGASEMGVGLLFTLYEEGKKQCTLGITGDTAWTPFLVDDFNQTDILVAHLGTIHETEIEKREFYKKHLGILGLYSLFTQLLQQPTHPKIMIISEFGEELAKARAPIADVFQYSFDEARGTRILPADIGLKIRLEKRSEIEPLCSFKKNGRACNKPARFLHETDNRIAVFCEEHKK